MEKKRMFCVKEAMWWLETQEELIMAFSVG